MNDHVQVALRKFHKLEKIKSDIENNKLDNRRDVQILRKKIAMLNQDLIWAKQAAENAKLAYDKANDTLIKLQNEHKQYVEHLNIISKSHSENQNEQVQRLMKMMKGDEPLEQHKTHESMEDDKQDHTKAQNDDCEGHSQTDTNKEQL